MSSSSADRCLHSERGPGASRGSSKDSHKRIRSNSVPALSFVTARGQPETGVNVTGFHTCQYELVSNTAEWAEEIANDIQVMVAARLKKLIVRHAKTMMDELVSPRSQVEIQAVRDVSSCLKRNKFKTSRKGSCSSVDSPSQPTQRHEKKLPSSFSEVGRALNSRLIKSSEDYLEQVSFQTPSARSGQRTITRSSQRGALSPGNSAVRNAECPKQALHGNSGEDALRVAPDSPAGHKDPSLRGLAALQPDAEGVPSSCTDSPEDQSTVRVFPLSLRQAWRSSTLFHFVGPRASPGMGCRSFSSVSPLPSRSQSSRSTAWSSSLSCGKDSARYSQTTRMLRRDHDKTLSMKLAELNVLQQETEMPSRMKSFRGIALWLWLWGVVPWHSPPKARGQSRVLAMHWNQLVMLLAAVLVVIYRALDVTHAVSNVLKVNDLFLAIGSFMCIIACRSIHRCELLDMAQGVLMKHAQQHSFMRLWCVQSLRHLAEALLCWVLTVGCRAFLESRETWHGTTSGLHFLDSDRWVDLAAYAGSTGVVFAVAFCQMHFTNALLQSIDCFGVCFAKNPDAVKSIRDWNLLQALLREASFAMEQCILVLVSTLMAMLFICGVGSILEPSTSLLHSVPPLALLLLSVSRVVLNCAKVTGICGRVSPFVVSLSAESNASERAAWFQLVEFIDGSDAGFYINEMKITMPDAMKLVYLCCLAMGTILTKATAGY